jgi:hypothetical protein
VNPPRPNVNVRPATHRRPTQGSTVAVSRLASSREPGPRAAAMCSTGVEETPHALAPLASPAGNFPRGARPRASERQNQNAQERRTPLGVRERNRLRFLLPSHPGGPLKTFAGAGLLTPGVSALAAFLLAAPSHPVARAVDFAAFVPVTVAGAVPALHRTSLHHQRSVAAIARTEDSCQEGSSPSRAFFPTTGTDYTAQQVPSERRVATRPIDCKLTSEARDIDALEVEVRPARRAQSVVAANVAD